MLKSKIFWITTVIVAIVIFITSLNTGRAFKGETDILFVPVSEKAAQNIEQILANAEMLPLSLSFYDKLLELNPDIEDQSIGQTNDKRKIFWENQMSLKQIGTSGIVRVGVFSKDQTQAEIISQKVAADVIAVMGRYYDTENDLKMRIVDGPIVFSVNQNKIAAWIILSLLLGTATGMLFYLFSTLAKVVSPKTILSKPAIFSNENIFEFSEAAPKVKEKTGSAENASKVFNFPETETPYFTAAKNANAPENLPIGGNLSFESKTEKAEPESAEVETEKKHEATEEEVRARLNKLLGGGM